jgi:hypothetical protein
MDWQIIIGNIYVISDINGAPEERRRQSPERSVIPEEFGLPARHLIPANYTSLTGSEADSTVVRLACNASAGRPGVFSLRVPFRFFRLSWCEERLRRNRFAYALADLGEVRKLRIVNLDRRNFS